MKNTVAAIAFVYLQAGSISSLALLLYFFEERRKACKQEEDAAHFLSARYPFLQTIEKFSLFDPLSFERERARGREDGAPALLLLGFSAFLSLLLWHLSFCLALLSSLLLFYLFASQFALYFRTNERAKQQLYSSSSFVRLCLLVAFSLFFARSFVTFTYILRNCLAASIRVDCSLVAWRPASLSQVGCDRCFSFFSFASSRFDAPGSLALFFFFLHSSHSL